MKKKISKLTGIAQLNPLFTSFVVEKIKDTWDLEKHNIHDEISKALNDEKVLKLAVCEKGKIKAFFIFIVLDKNKINPIGIWAEDMKSKIKLYKLFKNRVLPKFQKPLTLYYTIGQKDYFKNHKLYDEINQCYKVIYE